MYTLTKDNNTIIRNSDRASIPLVSGNRDYQDYLNWVAKGNTPTPYTPPASTSADVETERSRRLALGFNYDFQDVRGVHHIGTTEKDLVGWDEVSKLSSALLALGDTTTQITIVTNTGACQVTSLEWQHIVLAAAAFRQPIWASSFALQAQNPIPSDYNSDVHW